MVICIIFFSHVATAVLNSCVESECHEIEYDQLLYSRHSEAWDKKTFYPIIQAMDENEVKQCNKCHAPLGLNNTENLMCDFCHVIKVAGDDYAINEQMIIEQGLTRYGAHEIDDAPHPVEYDPIYSQSEFCRPCHEYSSAEGVPLFTTFTEWEESEYANPDSEYYMTCQDCHMPLEDGIRTHYFGGPHVKAMLEKAASVDIEVNNEVYYLGEVAVVTVNVTNVGVGHDIPSGESFKNVLLKVIATDENNSVVFDGNVSYMKKVKHEPGSSSIWFGSTIVSDNRLNPLETRTETLRFNVPENTGNIQIRAMLSSYSREMASDNVTIEVTDKQYAESTLSNIPGFGIVTVFCSLFMLTFLLKRRLR